MTDLIFEHNIWNIVFDKLGEPINEGDKVKIKLKNKEVLATYSGLDENLNANFKYKDKIIKIPREHTNKYIIKETTQLRKNDIISEIANATLSDDAINSRTTTFSFIDLYEESALLTTENYIEKTIKNLMYLKAQADDDLQYEISTILNEAINKLKKIK